MKNSKEYLREIIGLLCEKVCPHVYDALYLLSEGRTEEMRTVEEQRKRFGFTSELRNQSFKNSKDRYDLEYLLRGEVFFGQGENSPIDEETHYWYYSPILEEKILDLIVSSEQCADDGVFMHQEMRHFINRNIIDIGCGNGALLKKLLEIGIPKTNLFGIDISDTSVQRVYELGIKAYKGPIQNLHWEQNSTSIVFLSYFVDRDSDQKATFETSARILHQGGLLILEGLFPCVLKDSNGISYGQSNITKGKDPVEDIMCVVEKFKQLKLSLNRIIVGQRLVYSLDGSEVLPSYTLIFQKDYIGSFSSH